MSSYKTVVGEAESVTVIERSKFICSLKGVKDEEEAKEYVDFIRKKYSIANHNCYAYIADEKGLIQKFSDAGEPQGTAGMPMLNVLKSQGIYKVVAVVTRYFGGIKLGTGGLARAYSGAVISALNSATVKELFKADFISVNLSYSLYKKFSALNVGTVISVDYDEEVTVRIAVKVDNGGAESAVKNIKEVLGDAVTVKMEDGGFFPF